MAILGKNLVQLDRLVEGLSHSECSHTICYVASYAIQLAS